MAEKDHLKILEKGVRHWNNWRKREPDRRPDLRGADFTGKDFTGADFSKAWIQGTNFTKTKLKGAEFSKAEAGLTRLGETKLLVGLFFISVLLGFLILFCAALIGYFFTNQALGPQSKTNVFRLFAVVLFIIIFGSVKCLGLRLDLLGLIVSGTAILTAFGWLLAVAKAVVKEAHVISCDVTSCDVTSCDVTSWICWILDRDEAAALTIPVTALLAGAIMEALTLVTVAIVGRKIFGREEDLVGNKALVFSLAGVLFGIFLFPMSVIKEAMEMPMPSSGKCLPPKIDIYVRCVIAILVVTTLIFSVYLARTSSEGNALIFKGGVFFAAIGGTSFQGADLTDADFSQAMLRSADFRDYIDSRGETKKITKLIRTCWEKAKELDLVRPGVTYLRYEEVHDLLVKEVKKDREQKDGKKKEFKFLDLQGINLEDVNLTGSCFMDSDLSQANLRNTDLSGANLVRTKLYESDLTGATLTGACIEGWGISMTTKLDEVKCDFIFMKSPTAEEPDQKQERRPADKRRKFRPGEFASLVGVVTNTVDLVFQDGIDWEAFLLSFKELQDKYGEENIAVQAIEKKSGGAFVVRIEVPAEANKAVIESEAKELYKTELQKLEAQYRAELKSLEADHKGEIITLQNEIITLRKEHHTDILELAKLAASRPITVEAKEVTNRKIYAQEYKETHLHDKSRSIETRDSSTYYENYNPSQQTLAEAAAEIQKLLKQLEETNPNATEAEKVGAVNKN